MQSFLALSLLLNVALSVATWLLWQRAHAVVVSSQVAGELHRKEVKDAQHTTEVVRAEYLSLATVIADCIKEVRRDIDRNYCHVHDGNVLDRLAHEFKGARGPIRLDNSLETAIRDAGGGAFITDGMMLFSGALMFAWHVHEEARRNAGAIFEVVRESCGTTDRSLWLCKTLALYQRICDDDKNEAIRSLADVVEHWRHTHVNDAVRFSQSNPA